MPKRYAYNTSATQVKKRYAMIGSTATQVKKRYAMIGSTATLVYQAQSDTLTVTATAPTDNGVARSNIITNTENYTKMVIESVSAYGGNYGNNWAKLYVNGTCVKNTGDQGNPSSYQSAVKSWSGSFDISQNGTVYVEVRTDVNTAIDDFGDAISATVKFHFE